MITKKCGCCKEDKKLTDFFSASFEDRAATAGKTSMYCKSCHADGKIQYGYGWYGDKYQSPSSI